MPKEVIYSAEPFGDGPEVALLQLTWGRDIEHVQIASTIVDKSTHSPIDRSVNGGWWINLDRSSINQLIKNLRKARDQAYGPDE